MVPIVYHPDYVTPLPPGHRFPMAKFGLLYEYLLAHGLATPERVHRPTPASRVTLQRAHDRGYVDAFCEGTVDASTLRRIGLPWSTGLVRRTCTAVGGTIRTAELALTHGVACNTAGGTHHAHADGGLGFCIFNDLAVAARSLRDRGDVHRVCIVDLDVHQGDGTAAILADDPTVFTLSIHCEANFPARKPASDWDVGLPPGLGDAAYLSTVAETVPSTLDRVEPDLVLYDAGVDPHAADRLGKLALSDEGLLERDRLVLTACVARGIPVAAVIGGGYSDDIHALPPRHALVHRAAGERG